MGLGVGVEVGGEAPGVVVVGAVVGDEEPMTEVPDVVRHRLATEDDESLIFHAWMKEFEHTAWADLVPTEIYYRNHRHLIHGVLEDSHTLVACDVDDPDIVFGFICGMPFEEALLLHWMYVKRPLRSYGIGKGLLRSMGWKPGVLVVHTHMSLDWQRRMMRTVDSVYNPYLLFDPYRKAMEPQYVKTPKIEQFPSALPTRARAPKV